MRTPLRAAWIAAACMLAFSSLLLASTVVVSGQPLMPAAPATLTASSPAPVIRHANRANVVPLQWIVQTNSSESTDSLLADLSARLAAISNPALPVTVSLGYTLLFQYDVALFGFALRFTVSSSLSGGALPVGLTPSAVADFGVELLASSPGVQLVEEDSVKTAIELQSQSVPSSSWNLDRVDQRQRRGDRLYYYNATGENAHAYVLDTGIRITHQEFEGRAAYAWSAFDNSLSPNADDKQGHGTHVAGTVGGKTYGLAKRVTLHAVRVLDDQGSGSDSGVIAGVDWVARNRILPAVAVMSLGGEVSSSLDTAVKNLVAKGVSVAVAAGNSNADACNSSPARADTAVTVAAIDTQDRRATFSNWGACVTVFAPGVQIVSAAHTDDTSTATMSGTSMAAPHVAGALALYHGRNPSATPEQAKNDLICYSTKDAVSDPANSPNRNLYSIINNGPAPPPNESSGPILGGDSSAPSDNNNQNEQCTSASPCEGPFVATLTSDQQSVSYTYTTSAAGGTHRAWLNYNTGGGTLLAPQRVLNHLSLQRYNSGTSAWVTVATATDSNNAKNIFYTDDDAASPAGGSAWAWVVQAKGYMPTKTTLSYKKPSAPPSPEPAPQPTPVDKCSATNYFDPSPDSPNNVGQDPNPDSATHLAVPFAMLIALMVAGMAAAQ